jgi:hypothetical protein
MPRVQARAEYDHLMAARAERRVALTGLLNDNGVVLSDDDAGVAALDVWFCSHVELSDEVEDRLQNLWYAVIVDMALFMGDLVISQAPSIHWEFFLRGKRNAAYQRPVLMGFTEIEYPSYNADLIFALSTYGLRMALGRGEGPGLFVKMMVSMRAKAGVYL